jgi:hypothetical protein
MAEDQDTPGNPKRIDSLVVNEDSDAPSLLNPLTGQILITNQSGKRIIELADGTRSVQDIATQVLKEFRGAEKSAVVGHTVAFLARATVKGIVTWPGQS